MGKLGTIRCDVTYDKVSPDQSRKSITYRWVDGDEAYVSMEHIGIEQFYQLEVGERITIGGYKARILRRDTGYGSILVRRERGFGWRLAVAWAVCKDKLRPVTSLIWRLGWAVGLVECGDFTYPKWRWPWR